MAREGKESEATVGGDPAISAGPSSNPSQPGAAIALVAGPTFGDLKPNAGYFDERAEAARDALDPPIKPIPRDLLSEAVGAQIYGETWNRSGWEHPKSREPFTVSRFYMHINVAIDFPDERQFAEEVSMKREVLRGLGVVYIVVAPREEKTKTDIVNAIAAERTLLQGRD